MENITYLPSQELLQNAYYAIHTKCQKQEDIINEFTNIAIQVIEHSRELCRLMNQ